jgi:adenylate kinase family enzyme
MVSPLDASRKEKENGCHRALIVEIVGPAGAGKSTLLRALERQDPGFQVEYLPPVWNVAYIPFFVKHILLLAPTLVRIKGKGDRKLTRRELAWMAMLGGWPKILKEKAEGDHRLILLDQGPVFLMTILSEFGPESLRNQEIKGYWEKVKEKWIHTLDVLIYLDTPDEILINRIRTRQDEHLMKNKTDQEIKEFLAIYRRAYKRLINTFTMKNNKIQVLQMCSDENSVDDLVRCVLFNFSNGNKDR